MIKGKLFFEDFTIDKGELIKGSKYTHTVYDILQEPVPGPQEGDPDFVMFERLKEMFLEDIELVEYVPMELDPNVVY